MYPDLAILLSLHALYNIVDPVRSGAVIAIIIVNVLINKLDKNSNLNVDLSQMRLFVFMLLITVQI